MPRTINILFAAALAALSVAVGAEGCGSPGGFVTISGAGGASGPGAASTHASASQGPVTSSSSSSSSSGTGGAGGSTCDAGTECKKAGDCPTPADPCVVAGCTDGCCSQTPVALGTTCIGGGSGMGVCDGMGNCVACVTASDCPAPQTLCVISTCTNNVCGTVNAAVSSTCNDNGGTVCDGNGACMQCIAPSDCPPTGTVCAASTCTANTCGTTDALKATPCTDNGGTLCDGMGNCVVGGCADGIKNGMETAVDCGGPVCSPCPDGDTCSVGTDCKDGVCSGSPATCQSPTCNDGVKNGMETDKDCGGVQCPKCGDTLDCLVNADCLHNICFGASPGNPGTCVSCSDGAKDGNETGTDCGGANCDALGKTCPTGQGCQTGADCQSGTCMNGTCQAMTQGGMCTTNAQCTTGHCVQGVCCATACSDMGAMSCGTNGQCKADGSGCQDYASATTCVAASCADGANGSTQTTAKQCDGNGNCNAGGVTTGCGPYTCGGTACKTSCASNADCAAGNFCNGTTCMPTLANGGSCSGDMACQSGHCVANVCCSAPCTDTGAASCGTNGQCAAGGNGCLLYPSGTVCITASCADHANNSTETLLTTCDGNGSCNTGGGTIDCGGYRCGGTTCKTACSTFADCSAGYTCNGTMCVQLSSNGTACSNSSTCASGHCTGGICCAVSCTDQGAASCGTDGQCNAQGTACVDYPQSTQCLAPSCADGPTGSTQTSAKTCNGQGTCNLGGSMTSCGTYKCGGNACKTSCNTVADCAAGNYCNASGQCVPENPNGLPCSSGNACTSGLCMGGICCAMACVDQGAASCGTNGACTAAGTACALYPSGTQCAAATCTDGSTNSFETAVTSCNGSGSCNQGGGQAPCGDYKCGGTTCKTTCASNADCATNYTCAGNACLLSAGQPCTANNTCASNVCGTTGTGDCCTSACTTGGKCGATGCSNTGACSYPGASTSCAATTCSGSTLTTFTTCNGNGACSSSSGACPGNLICASGTACLTGCGANSPTGDANCVSGFYCNGTGAGSCVAKGAAGAACSRAGQCISNSCSVLGKCN